MFSINDNPCSSTSSSWSDSSTSLSCSVELYSPSGELKDPIAPNTTLVSSSSSDPGSGFGQAFNLGTLNGTRSLSNFVGNTDPNDYYRLDLSAPSNLNIVLNGLSADATLQLFNSSYSQIGRSAQLGTLAESINLTALAAGTYYVQVSQASGDTNYTLNLSSTSLQNQTSSILPSTTTNTAIASAPTVSTSTTFSIVDASGDSTPYTAFQGGALQLSYNMQNVASLSNVRLEALRNGSVLTTLGTWSAASLSNTLINLASVSALTADDYQFRVVASNTTGQEFASTAQSFKILNNSRINGTFAADTLNYSAGLGTGAVFLGRGSTDVLNLAAAGISRTNVTSINGLNLNAFNPLFGSTTNQAIYGGTAFDYITLGDGREIYFQGIEYLQFADGTSLELQVRPNDTFFSDQWNLSVSDVTSAWRYTQGASNVLIASLDTGILTAVGGSGGIVDIATNRLITDATDDDNYNNYGHGHSAISIMSATANNSSGIAGINWNSSVYVNDVYNGVSIQQAIKDTMTYAIANNMKVVFQGGIQGDFWLTQGGTQAELENLIQLYSNNAIFAIAAGNGGPNGNYSDPNYLTSVNGVGKLETTHSNVMSVGALQRTATATVNGMTNATAVDIASYSNRGSNLTLVAATDSPAMDNKGNMAIFGGTSAANPNLAGITSLVWSVNSALNAAQVRQILTDTAMDLGTTGRDNTFGYGLVNADAAVRRAAALQRNAAVANLYAGNAFV
jgi:serine protease